jgi:hypothetical protein
VILQPFSNISKLELLLDAGSVEGGLASDAGAEEELGRAERTLGDDDLLASAGDVTRTSLVQVVPTRMLRFLRLLKILGGR